MAKTFKLLTDEVLGWLDEDSTSPIYTLAKAAVNDANAVRVADGKWKFMLAEPTTLTLVPGTRIYTLAADFMKPHWFFNQTVGCELREMGPSRQSDDLGTVALGQPNYWPYGFAQTYTLEGNKIRLGWTPTTADTILYQYFKQPTTMTADADVPDIPAPYSNVLVYDALFLLKAYTTEQDNLKVWEEQRRKWETNLIQHYYVERPLGALPEYVHYDDEEWD